jgi:hypothetical protein
MMRAFLQPANMEHSKPSDIDRLIALAEEAERIVAQGIGSHDIRHACAVARGYLDLAVSYNEPVNVEHVEEVLARMRALVRAIPSETRNVREGWESGNTHASP